MKYWILVLMVMCVPMVASADWFDDAHNQNMDHYWQEQENRKQREVYQAEQRRQQYKNRVQQECLAFSKTQAAYDRCMYVKGGL